MSPRRAAASKFADFAVFRFFVLADFFNTGMEAVCRKHRIIAIRNP